MLDFCVRGPFVSLSLLAVSFCWGKKGFKAAVNISKVLSTHNVATLNNARASHVGVRANVFPTAVLQFLMPTSCVRRRRQHNGTTTTGSLWDRTEKLPVRCESTVIKLLRPKPLAWAIYGPGAKCGQLSF